MTRKKIQEGSLVREPTTGRIGRVVEVLSRHLVRVSWFRGSEPWDREVEAVAYSDRLEVRG